MLTAEELEARRKGIGGSEIAALLGLDPFRGALDIYISKVDGFRSEATPDMERGIFLEPGIANWHAHREGLEVYEPGHLVHPSHPLAMCTPDRFARVQPEPNQLLRNISIKAPRRAGDEWGDTGGATVPVGYVLQLQWEDMVCCARGLPLDPVSHLVALIDGELRVYPIERDVGLQGVLLTTAEAWWAKHVVPKVPPPLDGSDGASDWIRRRFPRNTTPLAQATLDDEMLMLELKAAEQQWDAVDHAYNVARQRIEERIGDAEGLEGAAGRILWRANKLGIRSLKPRWKETT